MVNENKIICKNTDNQGDYDTAWIKTRIFMIFDVIFLSIAFILDYMIPSMHNNKIIAVFYQIY